VSDKTDQDKPQDGDKKDSDNKDDKPKSRLPLIILGIVLVVAIVGGVIYWLLTRNFETTDDAYTEGNAVAIAAKLPGYVTERDFDDNQFVKAGQLLLKIDPRDAITQRDQARANLSLAQSQLASAENDLVITRVRAPANLQQAQAQLAQARANQSQARRDYCRQRSVDPRATTETNIDQATATLQTASANVSSAEAQLRVAKLVQQNIQAAVDTVRERQSQVAQAMAQLEQAQVNLSYAIIRAPADGRITLRNVDVGTYAEAGQQLFYIVSPDVWIVANYKESELARMRPGEAVTIKVDAYPKLKLRGHVDSIEQGSGARFTAFPAENATGNYVKIVRRVPVKIIIDRGLGGQGLPLGLSVEPTVTLGPKRAVCQQVAPGTEVPYGSQPVCVRQNQPASDPQYSDGQ